MAMTFCPDCNTNLDDVPADEPCPGCGGNKRWHTITIPPAVVQATAQVGVSVGMADSVFWLEQWRRVETALALLRAAYEPGAKVSSNVEVDLRVRSFFIECHHLGNGWMTEDLEHLPKVESDHVKQHAEKSQALSACEAICNKAKHARRNEDPRTHEVRSTGRVLRTDLHSNGAYSVPIRVDWAPKSEWVSESPSCFDALELAEDCVTSWREFFAAAEVARRSDGDPAAIAERIARLPDRGKRVVSLYYYDQLTMREIGEVLGVSESRVSRLHKQAITRLRGATA